jgi:hypothetical protein
VPLTRGGQQYGQQTQYSPQERARQALTALNCFVKAAGINPSQVPVTFALAEMLTSVKHFAQQQGIPWQRVAGLAALTYAEERDISRSQRGGRRPQFQPQREEMQGEEAYGQTGNVGEQEGYQAQPH